MRGEMLSVFIAAAVVGAATPDATPENAQTTEPKALGSPHSCQAYPRPEAVRGAEGIIPVSFNIGTDGKVKDVVVTRPSGSAALDRAAKACVSEFMYAPATRNGTPIEVPWKTVVSFCLTKRCRDITSQIGQAMAAEYKAKTAQSSASSDEGK